MTQRICMEEYEWARDGGIIEDIFDQNVLLGALKDVGFLGEQTSQVDTTTQSIDITLSCMLFCISFGCGANFHTFMPPFCSI